MAEGVGCVCGTEGAFRVYRMSGYGLKVFDSSGNVTLDTMDTITRFRYSKEVAAGASSNVTLSDISGLDSVEIAVSVKSSIYASACHLIERSGTTITWTALSGTMYSSTDSLIFVFLYS